MARKISVPDRKAKPRFSGLGASSGRTSSPDSDGAARPGGDRGSRLDPPKLEQPRATSPAPRIVATLALIVVVVIAVRTFRSERETAPAEPTATPSAARADVSAAPTASAELPPRCADVNAEGFVIGDEPKPAPDAGADSSADDPNAPFAVEVGRGAAFDGGFAIGALREAEGGTVAMLATLGVDAKSGTLVRLARLRGDFDPPVVAGAGASVVVAFLEPNAGGRALKLGKVTGEQIAWGPELKVQKQDSNAVDVVTAGGRAVVAWEDVSGDGERGIVDVASLDVGSLKMIAEPRALSRPETDGENPRVVARPGGFWLAWVAHGEASTVDGGVAKKPAKPKVLDDENSEEVDTDVPAGEAVDHRWIEVMPLDEAGGPAGAARAVTSKEGAVLAYDLRLGADGGALVAYRDDDTPTGSAGGRLATALVKLDGAVEAHAAKDDVAAGVGAPTMLPGWLSMNGIAGRGYLASMTDHGELTEALDIEPALANGEIMAGAPGVMLVARQHGRAVRLTAMKCAARPAAPAAPATSGR
ncbi:MAG TPA: hypothetical protein VGM56_16040 [Byssovorax sp.]